jgi:NADH:ubiquinone oxidoreductase subunit E
LNKVNLDTTILDQDLLRELDEYIETLEDKQGNLIHVLHKGQSLFGFLPQNLQLYIARALDLPAAKVNGVVSFYSYFTEKERGKNTISVCMGTACFVKGADKVLAEFLKELGVEKEDISEDGLFTVRDVRCVGACGLAPVVVVNEKVYGHVGVKDVKGIIEEYQEEATE